MPRSRLLPALGDVPLALMISVLAGVLVAGLALPAVAGVALVTKAGADEFEELPTDLANDPLPQRSRLLAADGQTVLADLYLDYDRVNVDLAQVTQQTRNAFLAIEDSRFYAHDGVDLQGLARAAVANQQAGEVTQGGSTLTQQYVKQRLLQSAVTDEQKAAATEATVARKLREARLALELETDATKDQILEGYLNIAYFGDGVYGVGTAATHYFSVPVEQLTLPQAALLAGLVQQPEAFNPTRNPDRARDRRDLVLRRMADLGLISPEQRDAGIAADLGLQVTETQPGCAPSAYPWFCDLVLEQLLRTDVLGTDRETRTRRLFQGGLDVTTTLDVQTQQSADAAVQEYVPTGDEFGAAVAMVRPGTGEVLAVANNRVFGEDDAAGQTTVNFATGRGGGGVQAGSVFKVFTLTTALQEGVPYDLTYFAPNRFHSVTGGNPPDEYFGNAADEGEAGTYDLRRAIELSVNTFFVPLQERVGVADTANLAQRMGVEYLGDPGGLVDGSNAFTLGTQETTPLSVANAFATLAAGGRACEVRVVASIVDADGTQVPVAPPACEQVLRPGVAEAVGSMLQGVLTRRGTAPGAAIGRPAAGKTGTAQSYRSAFFAGYVPQLAAATWVGHPTAPEKNLMERVRIGGQYYRRVFGGTLPGPMWSEAMRGALSGVPEQSLPGLDRSAVAGEKVTVPSLTGQSAASAGQELVAAGLGYQIGGGEGVTSDSARVLRQSVRPGRSVDRGTTVVLSTTANSVRSSTSSSRPTASSRSGNRTGSSSGRATASPTPSPSPSPAAEAAVAQVEAVEAEVAAAPEAPPEAVAPPPAAVRSAAPPAPRSAPPPAPAPAPPAAATAPAPPPPAPARGGDDQQGGDGEDDGSDDGG